MRKWHPDSIVLLAAFVIFFLCLLAAIVIQVQQEGDRPSRAEWTVLR